MRNSSDSTNYSPVAAALLHDIGKFKQRAFASKSTGLKNFPEQAIWDQVLPKNRAHLPTHQHAIWTWDFFENDLMPILEDRADYDKNFWQMVRNLASSHHNPSSLEENIIAKADRISSSQDRITDNENHYKRGDYLKVHLRTPFDHIRLDSTPREYAKRIFPLTTLNSKALFPQTITEEKSLEDEYQALWSSFVQELRDLKGSVADIVWSLSALLQKYAGLIPSATNDKYKDVSLFDHSSTSAVFAQAIWHYAKAQEDERREKEFLCVLVDVSGIQKFIFQSERGSSYKGRAKIIRARSFFLNILTQGFSFGLATAAGLTPHIELINAGGKMVLLLPNVQHIREKTQSYINTCEKWLFTEFMGELALVSSLYEMSAGDFGQDQFDQHLNEMNFRLAQSKTRKFNYALRDSGPIIEQNFGAGSTCPSCGQRTITAEADEICSFCTTFREIGSRIPSASAIQFGNGGQYSHKLYGGLVSFGFVRPEDALETTNGTFWIDSSGNDAPLPMWPYRTYVPYDNEGENQILSFEAIAEQNQEQEGAGFKRGVALLSVMKLDVDHLGSIFGIGFKTDTGSLVSVSRYVSLSRALNHFFNAFLPAFLAEKYPSVYTVFAGGDDVFLVAPWLSGLELLRDLRQQFERFTGGNPNLTFSCGISFAKAHYPIQKAARDAEHKLELAKDAGRNKACVYSPQEYSIFEAALTNALKLDELIQSAAVSTGFLRRCLKYARAYGQRDFTAIPQFYYDFARNIASEEHSEWLFSFLQPATLQSNSQIELSLTIALYKNRIRNQRENRDT